jgi:signal transduction histidine kinase
VRLVLSLKVDGHFMGLCLLGRRDPDDEYSASEIPTLQALMDQTALALINVEQSERLQMVSQINIERQETERRLLALELHDDVLHQMAILRMNVSKTQATSSFLTAYQTAVQHIREIISGLYPDMLSYGLPAALEDLADSLSTQVEGRMSIQIDLKGPESRYPPNVELHLYRIVQQACQNAIQHAQARLLRIQGRLEPDEAWLEVQDDGQGFETAGPLNLTWLLANRHFGLAGIFERAAFVGANVEIRSQPGQGTQVNVTWRTPQDIGAT